MANSASLPPPAATRKGSFGLAVSLSGLSERMPVHFEHFSLLAWLLGSLLSIASGAIWFGPKTFFPVWWKAMGRPLDEEPGSKDQMGWSSA